MSCFSTARGKPLLRAAVLLTGSQETGEDLLQAALEWLLRRWASISGGPEAYLRRTICHLAADGWRQQGLWEEIPGCCCTLWAPQLHRIEPEEMDGAMSS